LVLSKHRNIVPQYQGERTDALNPTGSPAAHSKTLESAFQQMQPCGVHQQSRRRESAHYSAIN
jgi:hypothetical protein